MSAMCIGFKSAKFLGIWRAAELAELADCEHDVRHVRQVRQVLIYIGTLAELVGGLRASSGKQIGRVVVLYFSPVAILEDCL